MVNQNEGQRDGAMIRPHEGYADSAKVDRRKAGCRTRGMGGAGSQTETGTQDRTEDGSDRRPVQAGTNERPCAQGQSGTVLGGMDRSCRNDRCRMARFTMQGHGDRATEPGPLRWGQALRDEGLGMAQGRAQWWHVTRARQQAKLPVNWSQE
jgi:hypothetical protein